MRTSKFGAIWLQSTSKKGAPVVIPRGHSLRDKKTRQSAIFLSFHDNLPEWPDTCRKTLAGRSRSAPSATCGDGAPLSTAAMMHVCGEINFLRNDCFAQQPALPLVTRPKSECLLLALFGPGATLDLSPQRAPKRTLSKLPERRRSITQRGLRDTAVALIGGTEIALASPSLALCPPRLRLPVAERRSGASAPPALSGPRGLRPARRLFHLYGFSVS